MRWIGVMLGLLLPLAPAAAAPIAPSLDPARIGGLVDGLVSQAMDESGSAGATVAVVGRDGILHARGYGIARAVPRTVPATRETLFTLGSISKIFIYLSVMQLVEAGRIALDDPVNRHLPAALRVPDTGFEGQPIRIRHLMSHTAGFEDLALAGATSDASRLEPLTAGLAAHRPRRVRPPGGAPAYSNHGATLLAAMVAHVTKMPFEDYVERRIFRPLGMATASFRQPYPPALAAARKLPAPLPPALAARSAQPLAGRPGAWREGPPLYHSHLWPAGSLRASADDMAALGRSLLDPGAMEAAGVLRRATFERMLRPLQPLPGTPSPAPFHGLFTYRFGNALTGFGHGGRLNPYAEANFVVVPKLGLALFVAAHGPRRPAWVWRLPDRIVDGLSPAAPPAPVRDAESRALAREAAGAWFPTGMQAQGTLGAMSRLLGTTLVRAYPDGDVSVGPAIGGGGRYTPIGGGYWRDFGTREELVLARGGDGGVMLLSGVGIGAFERAPAWRAFPLLGPVFGLAMLLGLIAIPGLLVRLANRPPATRMQRWAAGVTDLAAIGWLIGLGGAILFLVTSFGRQTLVFDWPGPLPACLSILAGAICLSIAGAVLTGLALRRRDGVAGWSRARTAWRLFAAAALLTASLLAIANGWFGWRV